MGCAIGPVAAVVAVANDDRLLGSTRPVLWLLLAGAVVILAICAANVATLLLVRATATQHESAVRSPLVGVIRFGGHLSCGEYDVQTDGRHTVTAPAPPVH